MNWLRVLSDGLIVTLILEGAFRVKGPVLAKKMVAYALTLALLVAEVFLLYRGQEDSTIFFIHPYVAFSFANLVYIILRMNYNKLNIREFVLKRIFLWQIVCITILSAAVLSCGWLMKLYVRETVVIEDDENVIERVLQSISIDIDPIDDIDSKFIIAADADEILDMESQNIVFCDYDKHPQDVFKTLKQAGFRFVSITVPVSSNDGDIKLSEGFKNVKKAATRASDSGLKVIWNIDACVGAKDATSIFKDILDDEVSVRYVCINGNDAESAKDCLVAVDALSREYERQIGTIVRASEENSSAVSYFDGSDFVILNDGAFLARDFETVKADDKRAILATQFMEFEGNDVSRQAEDIRAKCELVLENDGRGIIFSGISALFDEEGCPRDSLFTFDMIKGK